MAFLTTPIDRLLTRHERSDAAIATLAHIQQVARTVPAYRAFLAQHGLAADDLRTTADLSRLPHTSKDTYQRVYPLAELCWPGGLASCDMIALSSGSTGEPAVWPRSLGHEMAVAERFEQVFHDSFHADSRTTLAVVCFALGTWVGGMYTTACCRHLAAKGYRITTATPGNNLAEILRVLRLLGSSFDQIVLLGYPPFLKDVVDSMPAAGFSWPQGRVRLVTAGEVFSEEWRSLVCARIGSQDPAVDTASLYGTADGGVLACESPLSIRIRRFLASHPSALQALTGGTRLPTLCQYDPMTRWFECPDGELIISADGGIPLVRYAILDRGGIMSHDEMLRLCAEHGYDAAADVQPTVRTRRLPFVWVFGRTHIAVSLDGANIYPEHITGVLERPPFSEQVSGKFVMRISTDPDHNPCLECILELAAGSTVSDGLALEAATAIRAHLEHVNSEYAHYVPPARRTPSILLRPHRDPEFFPLGVKHRYVR